MLTFREFVAASQFGDDPEKIDKKEHLNWAFNFLNELIKSDYHYGDCTKQPTPCDLCTLEMLLSDYYQYRFNYNEWLKEQ